MLTNTLDTDFIIPLLKTNHDIKKIAYTGTHGTGKTTSVFNMATECKLNCNSKSIHILTELASESPFKINKETSKESQLWIFTNQIKTELELSLRYKMLISDRTLADCIAYSMRAGFDDMVSTKIEFAKSCIGSYDYIFFKKIDNNDFHFEDGVRDGSDTVFRKQIEENLLYLYDKLSPYLKHENTLQII